MPVPDFCCGAECGIVGSGATPNPDARHWTLFSGTAPTAQATIARNGGLAYRFTPAASVAVFRRPTSGTTRWARFYIRFETLPDIDTVLARWDVALGVNAQLRYRAATTDIYAAWGVLLGASSATVITTGVWYRIDIKVDVSTGTSTLRMQVDGVDKGEDTKAQTATTLTHYRIGPSVSTELVTTDFLFDDYLTGSDIEEYPAGEGTIIGLVPNLDGAHSFDTAGDFIYDAAGANVATDATDTFGWIDHTMESISTFINAAAAGNEEYLEWGFTELPSVVSINGLEVVSAHHAASATANRQSLRLVDDTTESVILDNADFSQTSLVYNSAHRPVALASGDPWTKPEVDAIRARWGSSWTSPDVDPDAYFDGLMLEVDCVPIFDSTGSGSPVKTLSTTASGAATQKFSGSSAAVKTLSATASGTAFQMFSSSGAAAKTLSAFASGTAFQKFTGSGSPIKTLSAFASGTANSTGNVLASGSPVATLDAFATGQAGNPEGRRGRGGGRIRVQYQEGRKEEPKKRRPTPRPEPVYEAQEAPVPAWTPLPELAPRQIDPAAWERIRTVVRVQEILAKQKETYEPIGDVDERLLRHFLEMIGAPPGLELDEEDMPFLLKRFLRMGR